MLLIKNAHLLPMEGEEIRQGYLRVNEQGKIAELGEGDLASVGGDEVLDAKGAYLCPGFVDAHSHIGLWEDSLSFEGADGNEDTNPVTPELRAIDGVNPMDTAFREALEAGVTTVVTGPGSANPIGGQFAAMKTHGVCVDEMLIRAPVAMKMALGENPKSVYHDRKETPVTRMGTAAVIRKALFEAKEYMEKWEEYEKAPKENERPEFDFEKEALIPVLKGELPVKIHAHRADDIFTALRLKDEFSLSVTIEHATDGHLIADYLKKRGVGVCVGPFLGDRSKPELKNLSAATAKVLSEAHVPVAIITDHPETPEKYLPLCAAMAVREGMDKHKALFAITKDAAFLSGISDRVGSLKVGKDADFLLYDRFPLDFEAKLLSVYVDGKKVK